VHGPVLFGESPNERAARPYSSLSSTFSNRVTGPLVCSAIQRANAAVEVLVGDAVLL
jgi:hypothetical protein